MNKRLTGGEKGIAGIATGTAYRLEAVAAVRISGEGEATSYRRK